MATGSAAGDGGHHSHYFSADAPARSRPATVRLDVGGTEVELHTDRGVFSPDRVDPGTRILLGALPADLGDLPRGPLVDLGCGYGPIACALALAHPERHVWAVDPNARARALCELNAGRLGITGRLSVHDVDEVPDEPVAAIVANPPIRIGKAALHELLLTWLDRLGAGGVAWLVVHRHLGADSLARWLSDQGWATTRLRSRQGYRVLRATRG